MDADVRQWLSDLEQAIRDRDFDAGQALFDATASGFGTVTERTHSREDLVERQWRQGGDELLLESPIPSEVGEGRP